MTKNKKLWSHLRVSAVYYGAILLNLFDLDCCFWVTQMLDDEILTLSQILAETLSLSKQFSLNLNLNYYLHGHLNYLQYFWALITLWHFTALFSLIGLDLHTSLHKTLCFTNVLCGVSEPKKSEDIVRPEVSSAVSLLQELPHLQKRKSVDVKLVSRIVNLFM